MLKLTLLWVELDEFFMWNPVDVGAEAGERAGSEPEYPEDQLREATASRASPGAVQTDG